MNHQTVTNQLSSIGACWAVSSHKTLLPNDNSGKPGYYIHPNAEYPHEMDIIKVNSLKKASEYVAMVKACKAAKTEAEADDIYLEWAFSD